MASVRLSRAIVDSIVKNIIKDTIQKKVDKATEELNNAGKSIVEACYQFDGATEAVNKLPNYYFKITSGCVVGITRLEDLVKIGEIKSVFEIAAPSGSLSNLQLKIPKMRVPEVMTYGKCHVFNAGDARIQNYLEKEEALNLLNSELVDSERELTLMLHQLKTVGAIVEKLPDLVKYIPEEYLLDSKKQLPAIRAESIMSLVAKLAT